MRKSKKEKVKKRKKKKMLFQRDPKSRIKNQGKIYQGFLLCKVKTRVASHQGIIERSMTSVKSSSFEGVLHGIIIPVKSK